LYGIEFLRRLSLPITPSPMLDALLLGGERFEQGLNRGAVGVLSGLAALQVGLNLREISVEGSCHRKHPGELGWQDCMSRGEKSQKAGWAGAVCGTYAGPPGAASPRSSFSLR
jgi:hypothetical protein